MYKVEVTETLSQIIEVEASSIDEALDVVESMYHDECLVLDHDNLTDVSFDIYTDYYDFTLDNIQTLKIRKMQELSSCDDMTEVDNDIVAFLTQHRYIVLDILDDVLYGRDKDE